MENFAGKTYRLIDVLDHEGNSKVHTKELYKERVGCIAQNLRKGSFWGSADGEYVVRMDFVQDAEGNWILKGLRTSPVSDIREVDGRLEIHTMYSVYILEEAQLKEPVFLDEEDVIELYLSTEGYQFAKGFYYDGQRQPHPLASTVHLGMFKDSVLIHKADDPMGEFVCRYFPKGSNVTFYDTIYGQQDYETPMVIHNTGDIPLRIEFEGFRATWTIPPGESKRIQPFCADGANPGSTEPSGQNV